MTGLRITKADLDWAVAQGMLREDQASPLWSAWSERRANAPDVAPRFSITHVLYYLGGMIAIGAMTLFMNLGWERFGPWALFGIAVGYAIGCVLASRSLAQRGLPLARRHPRHARHRARAACDVGAAIGHGLVAAGRRGGALPRVPHPHRLALDHARVRHARSPR